MARPRKPDKEKAKYQRVAMYPKTHQKASELAAKEGLYLVDFLDRVISQKYKITSKKEEPKENKKIRLKNPFKK